MCEVRLHYLLLNLQCFVCKYSRLFSEKDAY